jgi:serine/threonine protein kinase
MTRGPTTADQLWALAARSGLAAAADVRPPGASVTEAADRLVAAGRLTLFQAEKLLAGRWRGLVNGPYRLMTPIGRGGTGIVYLARDDRRPSGGRTSRLVALKVLSPLRAATEPRTLIRFRREMDLGRAIPEHPGLTATLDAGEAGGIHYLAMEYVPGRTARQLVAAGGPMTVPAAARAFADVAAGLHAAHQAGFVHRDTKPANVVVMPSGRAKVLDFGFALRRGEKPLADPSVLGGKGYTLGTLDYLPPEQASNAVAVGSETDVYSVGCSLYFVLAGRPPHVADSAREKIRLHRTADPTPLRDLNPQVPTEFAALVSWMMSKRPEDRPQTAGEVADLMERWAAPAFPVATLLSHDEAWEANLVRQVEAVWLAHRPLPIARPIASSEVEPGPRS